MNFNTIDQSQICRMVKDFYGLEPKNRNFIPFQRCYEDVNTNNPFSQFNAICNPTGTKLEYMFVGEIHVTMLNDSGADFDMSFTASKAGNITASYDQRACKLLNTITTGQTKKEIYSGIVTKIATSATGAAASIICDITFNGYLLDFTMVIAPIIPGGGPPIFGNRVIGGSYVIPITVAQADASAGLSLAKSGASAALFKLSIDNINWVDTLSIASLLNNVGTGQTVETTTVYIQFNPTIVGGPYLSDLTISSPGTADVVVAMSGSGI